MSEAIKEQEATGQKITETIENSLLSRKGGGVYVHTDLLDQLTTVIV